MNWLQSHYPAVREILWNAMPKYWFELKYLIEGLAEGFLIPEVSLPLASCKAVGGEAGNAVYVSAAVVAAATSLRILDDVEDQDRPNRLWNQVGPARAWNYASALQSLCFDILCQAPFAPEVFHQICATFTDAFLHIAYGQNRDLAGDTHTIEDYWATVADKIGYAYATACAAGAMIGTDQTELIRACRDFGFHLGFVIQIVNDMESIWNPQGVTDLKQGKVTLPLLYGLATDHPDRSELATLVRTGQVADQGARIKQILDAMDTRSFLVWAALQEREKALEAVNICPDAEGRKALEAYVTGVFGDIEPLIPAERQAPPEREPVQPD